MEYLSFTDTPKTLSDGAIEKWNQSTAQLIDFDAE